MGDAGTWIKCCAIGRNALTKHLTDGSDVVLYFGAGKSGTVIGTGCIYLFKDSLFVVLGTIAPLRQQRIELQLCCVSGSPLRLMYARKRELMLSVSSLAREDLSSRVG